ncbi:MAG: hydroxymethylglutaryl-CoA lyase [Bacteroidota bacterium]
MIKIIESPRDGWQGMKQFIPTSEKIYYIESLLPIGFESIEIGSFVSEKAIPQLKDTAEIIEKTNLAGAGSKIMVLAANVKGVEKACSYDCINQISFPYSISETFLMKNLNINKTQGLSLIEKINNHCFKSGKELVVYITMAFGNPYGDKWNIELINDLIVFLKNLNIKIISLTDILGNATSEKINNIYSTFITEYPEIEFGLHLHSAKATCYEKIDSAYKAGCRRFDTVINGLGGCPMTGKDLVGNLDTLDLLKYIKNNNISININLSALSNAISHNNL